MIYKVLILLASAGIVIMTVEWKKWSGLILLRNATLIALLALSFVFSVLDYCKEDEKNTSLITKIDSISNSSKLLSKNALAMHRSDSASSKSNIDNLSKQLTAWGIRIVYSIGGKLVVEKMPDSVRHFEPEIDGQEVSNVIGSFFGVARNKYPSGQSPLSKTECKITVYESDDVDNDTHEYSIQLLNFLRKKYKADYVKGPIQFTEGLNGIYIDTSYKQTPATDMVSYNRRGKIDIFIKNLSHTPKGEFYRVTSNDIDNGFKYVRF